MSSQERKCPTCSGRLQSRVLPDAQEKRVECENYTECHTYWYEEL